MRKDRKDVLGTNYIKVVEGDIKIDESEVAETWKSYFDSLLNQENPNDFEITDVIGGPLYGITVEEVMKAMISLILGRQPAHRK